MVDFNVKKIFLENDFHKIRKLEIEQFEDFDPLEIVIRDVKRFNNFTVQTVNYLIDNYDFGPKDSEYINLLLERYNPDNKIEEKILEKILEISEIDSRTVAFARVKNILEIITDWYKKTKGVDTHLLNLLDKIEFVTSQICGIPLAGNVIILETDKGMIWGDRDKLNFDTNTFYQQDLQYSMLHDGDMNLEKPIYRLNIGGRIFYVNENQRNILMNKRVITFSSYLAGNILVVQWGEPPESVDLYTFIPRDDCELYL